MHWIQDSGNKIMDNSGRLLTVKYLRTTVPEIFTH